MNKKMRFTLKNIPLWVAQNSQELYAMAELFWDNRHDWEEQQISIQAGMEVAGQDVIGAGSNRFVVQLGKYALKVNYCPPDTSEDQNKAEIESWELVKGTKVEKHFAPVLWASMNKRFIVMPLVGRCACEYKNKSRAEKLGETFDSYLGLIQREAERVILTAAGDLHEGNVGFYKGNIVALDYGL